MQAVQMDWETVQAYLSHHPRWFEDFGRRRAASAHLRTYRELAPAAWRLTRRGYWLMAAPPDVPSVAQGWKLHVSASSATSEATLRAALPVLREARVHFKFLLDPAAVRECNGKSFPRGSSGKFITVYPADEAEFRAVGDALTRALAGFDGPYILSDRRYPGSRVVFYRYGGFAAISRLEPLGISKLMIHAPDGTPVPDLRQPFYSAPPWASDPFDAGTSQAAGPGTSTAQAVQAQAMQAQSADAPATGNRAAPDITDTEPTTDTETTTAPETTLGGGRFTVTDALAFSNRGGLYRGTDTATGAQVVIREARPGVEVGPNGLDAVALLRHEYDMLEALADTGLFVRPVAYFTEWEHAFLVEEFIEGRHLGHLTISENPLYSLDLTPQRLTGYYEQLRAIWLQLADAVATCHARGIVLGDLSPTNVMVTDDGQVRVIDLESAFREDAAPGPGRGAGLHTPGLVTRRVRTAGHGDRRTDYYALGALMLTGVLLCHQADVLEPAVPRRLFAELAEDLALPVELSTLVTALYEEEAELPDPARLRAAIEAIPFGTAWRQPPPLARPVAPVLPDPEAGADLLKRIDAALDGIAGYALATADPDREDRLFPADAMVFQTNALSLAHGAYGTLYALHRVGAEAPDELHAWALRRSTAHSSMPPGLYYGTAGVAWAQAVLGDVPTALRTLRDAADHPLLLAEPGVATGAAGHGMACLRLWHTAGAPDLLDRALAIGTHLATTARREGSVVSWPLADGGTPVGYADGASGVAMFLLALHAATGDPEWLELGRAGLDFDLARARRHPSGLWSFPAEAAEATDTAEAAGNAGQAESARSAGAARPQDGGDPADGEDDALPTLRHYWDQGTAGVLTTALRYVAATGDAALRDRVRELLPDVRRKYTVFPQLFHGSSGLGNALLDAYEFLGDPELLGDAERVAAAVLCTAIDRPEGVVFPGEQMVRESCDLASGSAGVALFLDRLRHAAPGARTNANFVLDDLISLIDPAGSVGRADGAGRAGANGLNRDAR